MALDKDQLHSYVQKLLEVQKQKQEAQFSREERLELAQSLGFTQSDFEELEANFDAYIQRAEEFMRMQNFVDAQKELKEAAVVRPNDLNVLWLQSQCAYALDDKTEALRLAKLCVQINPKHKDALRFLTVLRLSEIRMNPKSEALLRKISIGFGVLVFLFSLGLFFYLANSSESTERTSEERQYGSTEVSRPSTEGQKNELLRSGSLRIRQETGLPVLIDSESANYNLDIDVRISELRGFGKSSQAELYYLEGFVSSEAFDLQRLDLRLELLNAKDELLGSKDEILFISSDKTHIPLAKKLSFSGRIYEKEGFIDKPAKLRVKVKELEGQQAQNKELPKVDWSWRIKQRKEIPLEIYELPWSGEIGRYANDKRSQPFFFELVNKGSEPLYRLDAHITVFDLEGKKLGENTGMLINPSSHPALPPGQAAIYRIYASDIPKREIGSYKLQLEKFSTEKPRY